MDQVDKQHKLVFNEEMDPNLKQKKSSNDALQMSPS